MQCLVNITLRRSSVTLRRKPWPKRLHITLVPFQAPSFNGTLVSTLTDADTTQAPQSNCTLDNTLLSTVTATSTSSDNSTALNSAVLREVTQHIFVPGIGWASQLGNGEIWVKFMDGTQLGMKSSATTITYIDTAGKVTK